MDLDNSEAELHRRAEWLLDQDILPAVQQTREVLHVQNESLQALQSLDAQWHGSPLPTLVQKAAHLLGSTYIQTEVIDPSYDRFTNGGGVGVVALPLRIGARVREIAYASETRRNVQAMRGNILLHRTMLPNGHWYNESAFYSLLVSMHHNPIPQLVFGRLDQPNATAQQLQQQELVGLEVLLGGVEDVLTDTFRARTISDTPKPHNVEEVIATFINYAKRIYKEAQRHPQSFAYETNWQTIFTTMYGREPSPDKDGELIDSLLASGTLKRRFKKDLPLPGILAQNQQAFVEGHSATLAVQPALQHYLQEVYQPMQTKQAVQKAVQAELDHATQLELINALEITDLDVARAVLRRAVKTPTTPAFAMPSKEIRKELAGHYRTPTYEDYAETKAVLNKHFAVHKAGRHKTADDDYETISRIFNRRDVATGKGLHVLQGILLGQTKKEGTLEEAMSRAVVTPSPAAFPLD